MHIWIIMNKWHAKYVMNNVFCRTFSCVSVHCEAGGREAGLSDGSILSHPGDQGRRDGRGLYELHMMLIRAQNCLDLQNMNICHFLFPDSGSRRNHHDQEEQEDVRSLITTGYFNKAPIYQTSVWCIIHSNKQEINKHVHQICCNMHKKCKP